MITLYIDTSSSYLYAGIVKDSELLVEVQEDLGLNLSEAALPRIVEMFDKVKLSARDINKVIVVNGPGSFTGIRVGLTIAKVFAWSLNIPITTITSLEAMALSVEDSKLLVPIIDARHGCVYAAIYDGNKTILEPSYLKLEDLYNKIVGDAIFITNDLIDLNSKKCGYTPNILRIVNKFVDKKDINPHMVNPEYLKLTAAEESKLNDRDA